MTLIDANTNIYCIIGHPVEHSFSPIIYNSWFNDFNLNNVYIALNILPKNLKKAINGFKAIEISGFNVTIPYKERIIKYVNEVDPLAKNIGAVNTVKRESNLLKGINTDAVGAIEAIKQTHYEVNDKNVVILGSGGAARAISYVLVEEVNKITILNRTKNRAINLAKELRKKYKKNIQGKVYSKNILERELKRADILINTTPIGMYPLHKASPVLKEYLHSDLFVFDLVYNPLETQLLQDASNIGCKTLSGIHMLINQAVIAFEWWLNRKPNVDLIKNKIIELLRKKNVR